MPDFTTLSLAINLAIFGGAAALVWVAGGRLAGYADEVSARTGLGQAFLGMAMLGVATSLPEVATTLSGSLIGNPSLVTGNLFGGVAMQIAVLAIADLAAVRGALTYMTPRPVLLFQGVMLMLLLALATAGAAAGEPLSFAGVGLTPVLVTAGYLLTLRVSKDESYLPRWRATHTPKKGQRAVESASKRDGTSDLQLYGFSAAAAAVILAAGWVLMLVGDALAEQTGLGASFVGVALVAASTSLPELSTTLGAIRAGNHEMAVSNILGTNCLEVALFLLADVAYREGPILATADQSAMLAAALGMATTAILLLGLLERRNRTIFGMGIDSFAILVVYGAGLVGLYAIR